jgi:hypothetical protein
MQGCISILLMRQARKRIQLFLYFLSEGEIGLPEGTQVPNRNGPL